MEKNTGKTECLNYIISRLNNFDKTIAITSIGIDGETVDQVTDTPKPEIEIAKNVIFLTSEKHYRQKQITAEIINVSEKRTSLGRLITARAKDKGKLIISGPQNTNWLKQEIKKSEEYKVDLFLVDGALSRKSSASPSVTDCMILTTGAALSANLNTLIKKTAFTVKMINLPVYDSLLSEKLLSIETGLWAIDKENTIYDLQIQSTLLLNKEKDKLFAKGNTIFISGIVTDNLLELMRIQPKISETVIIVKDFTKIFISPEKYSAFTSKGGKIMVLLKTNLIAICVNPISPEGYVLDSAKLRRDLEKAINIPVYDIKSLEI